MSDSRLKLPYFMKGTYANLEYILSEGVYKDIDADAYIFIEDKGMLAYVTKKDKQIHLIKGNNKSLVQKVTALPSTTDADEEVLYIMGGVAYEFDGELFNPLYQDITDKINNLLERVTVLEQTFDDYTEKISNLETHNSELDGKINDIDTHISAIDDAIEDIVTSVSTIGEELEEVELTKADRSTTLAGYGIADAYTASEVDAKIEDTVGDLGITSETGEPVTVTEYVSNTVDNKIGDIGESENVVAYVQSAMTVQEF